MNERDLFRAIGDVDDDLVTAARKNPTHKTLRTYLPIAVAACLCVALTFLAIRYLPGNRENDTGAISMEQNSSAGEYHYSTDDKESSPENSGGLLPTDMFSHAGVQTSTVPTESTVLLTEIPQDFSFTVTWAGNTFDSATGVLTENNGTSYTLSLTDEERYYTWRLLSALEDMDADPDGDIQLTFTANDLTRELSFAQNSSTQASLLCADILHIIEQAAGRQR